MRWRDGPFAMQPARPLVAAAILPPPSASVSALIYCGTPPGRCFDERDRLKVCDIVQVAGEKYAVVVDIGMVSYVLNTGQPK